MPSRVVLEKVRLCTMGRLTSLLVILVSAILAESASVLADQPTDLGQKLQALEAKAKACGQDPICLQKVAQEMRELAQVLQQPSGGQSPEQTVEMEAEERPGDPCAPVEQFKDQVRAQYKVEPDYIRCRPVQVKLTWQADQVYRRHLPEATDKVNMVLVEEFQAYLATYYNQQKKDQLDDIKLIGPSPPDQVHTRWEKLEAQITLIDYERAHGHLFPKGGQGFILGDRPALGLSWFRDTQFSEVEIASSAVSLDPSALPVPAGLRTAAPAVGFLDRQHFRVERQREAAFSPEEMKELVDSGRMSKTYTIEKRASLPGMQAAHTLDGRVTMEVNSETKDQLVVSPAQGFKTSGPDEAGRFDPWDKTYVLKNTGDKPLNFTVTKIAPWLEVSLAAGSLDPGKTIKVTASINQKALALPQGIHTDKIHFFNATSNRGSASRDAELSVGPEQRWLVNIKGWERQVNMPVTNFQDSDGSTKHLIKAVKFHWELGGQFRLKKGKLGWYFHDGSITSANLIAKSDFSPADAYDCQVKPCPGKATVKTLIGAPIVGIMAGNTVKLNWYPLHPGACLECQPRKPSLPQGSYDGFFESTEFIVQASMEWHPLKNGYSNEFPKKDWLRYRVSLKRIK